MLYLLLIAFMALPLAGTALALVAEQVKPVRGLAEAIYMAAIMATLLLGLILRPAQAEMIIGNWSPVSFTGTPLILSANPGGIAVLIAVAATMLISPIADRHVAENRWRPVVTGFVFAALCVTALAHDMVTLLVGISLVDIAVAVHGLVQQRQTGNVLRDVFFHAASIGLLMIAIALYDATGNSLYLPLAQVPERLMPFFSTALALRLCLAPLRAASDHADDGNWVDKASPIASLLLLSQLPQLGAPELHAWFFAFALLTALSSLVLGALTTDRSRLQTSIDTGGLAVAILAAVTWNSGIITAAAIAWLLGVSILGYNPSALTTPLRRITIISRLIGLLSLLGLPLTIGFIARSGAIAMWVDRGIGGAALILGFALAQILLTYCAMRLWRWADRPEPTRQPRLDILRTAALLAPTLLIFVFGLLPDIAGAPSLSNQISHNGLAGWIIWILGIVAGVIVWYTEAKWRPRIASSRERLSNVLGLGWWQDILSGAIDRLAKPLHGVITFLDSDGALLWAIIMILIVVLVSRPGGP